MYGWFMRVSSEFLTDQAVIFTPVFSLLGWLVLMWVRVIKI